MRLNASASEVSLQLDEFDIWVTPSLGEITDTTRYKEELELVKSAFEIIGAATDEFASVDLGISPGFMSDFRWLSEKGFVMAR